jgi:hypothetical protein
MITARLFLFVIAFEGVAFCPPLGGFANVYGHHWRQRVTIETPKKTELDCFTCDTGASVFARCRKIGECTGEVGSLVLDIQGCKIQEGSIAATKLLKHYPILTDQINPVIIESKINKDEQTEIEQDKNQSNEKSIADTIKDVCCGFILGVMTSIALGLGGGY